VNPDALLNEGRDLVEEGAKRGVRLRLLGSLGIRHHTGSASKMLDLLGRDPTRDIDFMGYSEDQARADQMFAELGFEADRAVSHSLEYGIQRLIYHRRDDRLMAEIFLDQLRMAHTLDFRGRLELDYPTISLVDLLLSKLQIQQITEKDIKDLIALFAEHDLGAGDRERIDVGYLLELTSNDWGLYHTAVTNLAIVEKWTDRLESLDPVLRRDVVSKIRSLIPDMEAHPKSFRWKVRGKIGTRVRWYEEVGDVHR
jgi:hypothetical protein